MSTCALRCANTFASAIKRNVRPAGSCRRRYHHEPRKGDKVVVAMSGGVDSSVAALLSSQKDYNLSAVYMRNWDTRDESGSDIGCEWEKEWEDVQRVCQLLKLPCELVDLSRQYWTNVFEPCLNVWQNGSTPNPDILCNREIKFGKLLDKVVPADTWLVTGHYAAKTWDTTSETPRALLKRPRDRQKDQTYFLSSITELALRRVVFPLQDLTKPEVRQIAAEHGLPTASRAESNGICFIGQRKSFNSFLSQYVPSSPGDVVDLHRQKLGSHNGLWTYTIGQGLKLQGQRKRWYVARKDREHNEIVAVPGREHPALRCKSVVLRDWVWLRRDEPPAEMRTNAGRIMCLAQYRSKTWADIVPCVMTYQEDGSHLITFDKPEAGVSDGQTIALYQDECCLGSGTIVETNSPEQHAAATPPAAPETYDWLFQTVETPRANP